MSKQYPGGIISKTAPVPTQLAASGVWTLDQQAYWQKLGQWPTPGYKIARSLRFNRPDSTYLTRTPSSAGNQQKWTWSAWLKRSDIDNEQFLFGRSSATNDSGYLNIQFAGSQLNFSNYSGTINVNTTQVLRDASAWYHIVVALDTTQATAANRVKMYVNGVQVTSFSSTSYPSLNDSLIINDTSEHVIGNRLVSTSNVFGGYMTEVNFVNAQQLTPSSFGETNSQTGVWSPMPYTGAYGTNGFYLNFSDNSNTTAATLGKDYSGNGNNWTPNNFSVTAGAGNDSLVDTPTPYGVDTGAGGSVGGNYAVWNPLSTTRTIINGNLYTEVTGGGGSNIPISSTMALPTTGKWYWEITAGGAAGGGNGGWDWGIVASSTPNFRLNNLIVVGTTGCYGVNGNSGILVSNATSVTTYISGGITGGDVAQIAYDADTGKLWLGKNNTWGNNGGVGDPAAGTNAGITGLSGEFIPVFEYASDSGLVSATLNMGQRPFAYTAPSGFKALCTQNLPTPTIGATSATLANKYFDINLWTGNGSSQTLTNTGGFQPDWVWLKSRSSGTNFHNLFDVIRGATKHLFSNTTAAEGTNAQSLTAFTSTGFSVGNDNDVNQSSSTYVGWQWKANGSGSSNTAGSITSTVSASTTSGFSVVTYTGTGANATVGHGLGVAPSMIIIKNRPGVYNWRVWHTALSSTELLFLNTTDATQTGQTTAWNSTLPSSTLFSLGSSAGVNESAATFVAYCFAPVAGYSAFGKYTGNGSADGPFIYTGFRPAFVMVKNTASGENWVMLDATRNTSNVTNNKLAANSSAVENDASIGDSTQNNFDFLSNGFKAVTTNSGTNGSSAVIIYMAFAQNPFKYSLAR
jgi:hypothetical protein